ncbi:cyclohexanone monooxygenase [Acaromyces ingoldii]|uniref:Cyclohexanone monooxygenase n=1 Tax=Acaromyces ingoldii TaxID=215250 RepID=A0A316YSJ2_9BASI|nr:cyclohexanone monooxygenase [Acaromyces ingoldii]PWN90695.1 cyclohexanone monooxygenase [Acaromyces ingoldii]
MQRSYDPFEIASQPASRLAFSTDTDFGIDTPRPMRVIVIGCGVSGIYAGIRLPRSIPNLSLTIFEKNADIGGTWFENRYMGCACDIPAHLYAFQFAPNPDWSSFYAPASEIRKYWASVAEKYDVLKYVQLERKVIGMYWERDQEGMWSVDVEEVGTGNRTTSLANVVLSCTGGLNEWKWPDVKGLNDFGGKLVHSANWDDGYDFEGKKVALIGGGSTGIQILPRLQKIAKQVDQYVRGPTWIGFPFLGEELDDPFTDEERLRFISDPAEHLRYRQRLMGTLNSMHTFTISGSKMQTEGQALFAKNMEEKLAASKNGDIIKQLKPSFPAGCRRLTPGPGYLEALTKDNVGFVGGGIGEIVKDGIVDGKGTKRSYDAIVCATGFNTSFTPRFPIVARGVSLGDKFRDFPRAYCSVSVDAMPNYFMSMGPNSAVGSGDLIIVIQTAVDYAVQCIAKLQSENYKSMSPQGRAVDEWQEYSQSYFRKTVFGQKCRSWYKAGNVDGPIYALWPGSCLHAAKTLRNPRWEDYEYEQFPGRSSTNRFAYLGNGFTDAEMKGHDTAWYVGADPELVLSVGQTEAALIRRAKSQLTNGK